MLRETIICSTLNFWFRSRQEKDGTNDIHDILDEESLEDDEENTEGKIAQFSDLIKERHEGNVHNGSLLDNVEETNSKIECSASNDDLLDRKRLSIEKEDEEEEDIDKYFTGIRTFKNENRQPWSRQIFCSLAVEISHRYLLFIDHTVQSQKRVQFNDDTEQSDRLENAKMNSFKTKMARQKNEGSSKKLGRNKPNRRQSDISGCSQIQKINLRGFSLDE